MKNIRINFILLFMFFYIICNVVFSQQERFPVGTGWVRTGSAQPSEEEREDKYWQVAECGININVGNVQSWERQAVLDSAEEYGIDIVAD